MARAKAQSVQPTMKRKNNSTLPHHDGSSSGGDTMVDVEMETVGEPNHRQSNGNGQNGDYPTPSSVEGGQVNGHQTFNISESSSTAISNISAEPRKLLDVIDRIAGLGIKSKTLHLPKIVAIGDQSAGKSSVIAAISGITVPRKAGLCTRCPSHINLHYSKGPWKCIVSLEKHYYLHERTWHSLQDATKLTFAEVEDPEDLQNILRRAQAAVLNPGYDPLTFVDCAESMLRRDPQVPFSPNLVALEISGPDCPDLTFYDLPGIFNQTSHKNNQDLPQMVRKLVMSYINAESHMLLVACSMEGDIENSSAASLIPEQVKHRCIGILTKPDRKPTDTPPDAWLSVLQGNAFELGHGYFVTKQPSQGDLDHGVDHAKAREDELRFFQSTPWAKHFAGFEDRCGTVRLQAKLSSLLVGRIRQSIPLLLEMVNERLKEVKENLATLPDPPGNKSFSIVMKIVSEIHNQLGQNLQGELPYNAFIRRWMNLCNKFNDALQLSRPTLVITTRAESEARNSFRASLAASSSPSRPDAITIQDSDDEDEKPQTHSQGNKRRPGMGATPSPQKRQRSGPAPSNSTGTSNPEPSKIGTKFTIEGVRETRMDKNTSAIGTHDHRADEYLILQSIKHWDTPLDAFINATESEIEHLTTKLLDQELRDWENTPFSAELREHVNEYLANAFKRHQEFAHRILQSENIKPMSLNQKSIKPNVKEETKVFQDARELARANLHLEELESKSGKIKSVNEKERDIAKIIKDNSLGPDEYSEEIETMGRVRGYYNVASTSFVDTICKAMRLDILERMRLGLSVSIEDRFKLNENDGFEECKRLLAEDASRAERRAYFLSEKEKYEKAKQSLDELVGPAPR